MISTTYKIKEKTIASTCLYIILCVLMKIGKARINYFCFVCLKGYIFSDGSAPLGFD